METNTEHHSLEWDVAMTSRRAERFLYPVFSSSYYLIIPFTWTIRQWQLSLYGHLANYPEADPAAPGCFCLQIVKRGTQNEKRTCIETNPEGPRVDAVRKVGVVMHSPAYLHID